MASPDSKSQNILPTSQPFNVNPGPSMYVEGAEIYVPVRKRPSTLRRVLRGLVFIFVSVLLCKWIFASTYSWIKGGRREFDIHDDHWHYDVPSDLVLDDCVQGSDWAIDEDSGTKFYHVARTSFDLPLSTDNLFVLSRGWLSGGLLEVVTSPDQAKDTVTVNIAANYHREYVRDLAKACLVSRAGNQQGVGIFTPTWESSRHPRSREDTMHFGTTVIFPESSEDSSLVVVKGFETDVPNTAHYVKSLDSKINFDSLSLKGSNGNIYVQTLSATKGSLHTSNGPIIGSFNTTTSLYLKTSNAAIQADVGLLSDSTEPILDARTSNGKIDARLRLTSSSGDGGKFDVSTVTSNSPVFAIVTDAPVDSTLTLEAKTSNGRAHVSLHPAYEGAFDVGTSKWFSADLNILPAADPSGKKRQRTTLYQRQKNLFFGSTLWKEEGRTDKGSGKVNVHTSNSAVVLDILGN